jgi:hypothetical protein
MFQDLVKELLTNRTKFETYILTFWFIILQIFLIGSFMVYAKFNPIFRIVVAIAIVYVNYNVIKDYIFTRSILEAEQEEK